jgi:hypothetical protein
VGELVCFAVDGAGANQVFFNHLTGSATVVSFDDADAAQTKQAFKYNAWAFTAETTAGTTPQADNTPVGTAGDLQLTGAGTGTYDACPLYLVESYSPGGLLNGVPNTLGNVTTFDNDLSLSSCDQDLREAFSLHLIKLKFTVWSAGEEEFSGAYQCADSVDTFGLDDPADYVPVNSDLSNFTFGVLRSHNARFEVDGISDPTTCPGSQAQGLVGVITSSIGVANTRSETDEIGNTLHGAGVFPQPGFVLWDPASNPPPEGAGRR